MKIRDKYKVRELAGEHVIVMQGAYGADMTRIIALNESSLHLWNGLCGREFTDGDVVRMLTEHYDVDEATARNDAAAWIARLKEYGIVQE